ncbi:MAG: PEP-CTERM sorting domain-containing protein [Phycisphaeraceae bacterium]
MSRSIRRACYPSALLVAVGVWGHGARAAVSINDTVYWTEVRLDNVQKAPLAGGGAQVVHSAPGSFNAAFIELDISPTQQLYWTDQNSSSINRSGLDGSNPQVVHTGGNPTDIEIDPINHMLYWTDSVGVWRAGLDGSNPVKLVSGQSSGLALDAASGVFYWTFSSDQVLRTNLDGTGTVLINNATAAPNDIEYDPATNQLFWTDNADRAIYRANADGTGLTKIVDRAPALTNPQRLALDGGLLYWSDNTAGRIEYANLDGTGQTVLRSGLDHPIGVAIGPVPEPASAIVLALGAATLGARRRRRDG